MALLSLIGPATKLIGKFIEDKDAKNKLAHEIATMAEKHAQELAKGQLAINKEEAKSGIYLLPDGVPSLVGRVGLPWYGTLSQLRLLFFLQLYLVLHCHHYQSLTWVA